MVVDNDSYSDGGDFAAWNAQPWTDQEAEALGLRPVDQGGSLYCSCMTRGGFAAPDGRRHQWPKDSVLGWHIGMSKLGELSDMDMKGAREETCKEINSYVKRLKLVYQPNPKTANLIVTSRPIDGSGMVLAEHEVAFLGQVNANSQLKGWFDTRDSWTLSTVAVPGKIDWKRTDFHELLHGLGFFHGKTDKSSPALLEAMYSWSIWTLQPRDIAELQLRYEAADELPQPTPPASGEYETSLIAPGFTGIVKFMPSAAGCSVNVTAKRDGKQAVLNGSKSW